MSVDTHCISSTDQTAMNLDFKDTKAILQHVLNTVSKRCKEEASSNGTEMPGTDIDSRISFFTGLTIDQVNSLISGDKKYLVPVSTLSISDRISILNAVKCLYSQNTLPTYESIYDMVKKTLHTSNEFINDINLFKKELNNMGFISKETSKNDTIVIEDPEIRFERYMYMLKLKKISNNPQWQDTLYVDERRVSSNHCFKKAILTELSTSKFGLDDCIFYHAVSSRGFLTGMFTDQVSENDFAKWLSDILLSHLKVPTVIILDNGPLHGPPKNVEAITRYHSKAEMIHWLVKNNVSCSNKMSKAALYDLCSKCKVTYKESHIDQIIRSHGHTVLRLPRQFYDLSITTPFWDNYMKRNMEREINTNEIQTNLLKAISSEPLSTWAEYEKSVVEYQSQLFDIDTVMETYCDAYEIIN